MEMRILSFCKKQLRNVYNYFNRRKLRNTDITLVASNCNGGCILSDLHIPFRSPFVNLWIKPKDFLKLCEDMRRYMDCDLKFVKEPGIAYPIGELDDIRIYFQHYSSEKEALSLWNKRKSRTNWGGGTGQDLYIIFGQRRLLIR